jgi:hypothetical protein
MNCHCADCSKNPKPTYSEQYRHEAEAREVMRRFGTKEQIKAYLEGIEKKRGFEAMQELRMDLLKEWEKRKGKTE